MATEEGNGADPVTIAVAAQGEVAEEVTARLARRSWQVVRAHGTDELAQLVCDAVIIAYAVAANDVCELCDQVWAAGRSGRRPLVLVIDTPRQQHVSCLRAGADGVLGPEAGAEEVLARLDALLRRVQVERDCSPLTGLPGNARFEQVLRDRLAAGETPAVLMLDIDNFKAFNDRYGHWRGDRVIKMLAEIVRGAAERDPEAFVAHVGGDDFLVISSPALVDEIAEKCKAEFDARAPEQYDESDRRRGYVTTRSRAGRRRQFRLMTLTLAAATAEAQDMQHIGQFFQVLAELKEYAKGHAGSTYVKDRRRHHGW